MIPNIQKILYATDLSPNSVYALRYAINSDMKHDADIVILHVFEKTDPAGGVMLDPIWPKRLWNWPKNALRCGEQKSMSSIAWNKAGALNMK